MSNHFKANLIKIGFMEKMLQVKVNLWNED